MSAKKVLRLPLCTTPRLERYELLVFLHSDLNLRKIVEMRGASINLSDAHANIVSMHA